MDKTEQQLRVELAACYRIFDYMGLDRTYLQPHYG